MDINQELIIETKELMDKCKENLMAAFDIFKQLQENPEYMKIVEGLIQEEAKEVNTEEADENVSADCIGGPLSCHSCCKQSYPCECRECESLLSNANRDYALFVYALNQAIATGLLALKQLGDADHYFDEAIKLYTQAIICLTNNNCCDYCKEPPKDCHWYCKCCICNG